jgi:L-amino acid N-acyltransferase YncA
MNHLLQTLAAAAALAVSIAAFAQTGPYAGEQQRGIKALDARDVAALRQGQGMGFAKAAELNGDPGPMHTLELAEPLQLSAEQRAATRQLMDEHKARARELGERVVQAEAALDRLFAERQATPERVREATQRIASLQAQLRAEHLNTHLAQTALMSPAQATRYAELRGYTGAAAAAGSAPAPDAKPSHQHRH